MTEERRTLTTQEQKNLKLWRLQALIFGWNELAKIATTMGEKTACRIARDNAEAEYASRGGVGRIDRDGPSTVLVLARGSTPYVTFREDDIELMRAAVRDHDLKATSPTASGLLHDGAEVDKLRARVAELEAKINAPETKSFVEGVVLEAAHQRERWSVEHDGGKAPADWYWLLGHLGGKALASHIAGDTEKTLHRLIASAAALANWHGAILGKTSMRPGIEPPPEPT